MRLADDPEGGALGVLKNSSRPVASIRRGALAVSSKTARNIVVNGIHYRWRATGNDGWITLVIWPHDLAGRRIHCTFGYDQTETPLGGGVTSLTRQLVVTNRLVRRVLLHAIGIGYDPQTKAPQLDLGRVDKPIDIADAERGR